ncbi:MAG TPA: hypothetical protein VH934_13965 [Xanthobacteraceae bacterium]|jgi:hypothetical protein
MATIIFVCPNMRARVQGWFADDGAGEGETYESILCPACRRMHLVNTATGKVLGSEGEE